MAFDKIRVQGDFPSGAQIGTWLAVGDWRGGAWMLGAFVGRSCLDLTALPSVAQVCRSGFAVRVLVFTFFTYSFLRATFPWIFGPFLHRLLAMFSFRQRFLSAPGPQVALRWLLKQRKGCRGGQEGAGGPSSGLLSG